MREFKVGDFVSEEAQMIYPGTIVATFKKLDGSPRCVVESNPPNGANLLTLFRPDQLVHMEADLEEVEIHQNLQTGAWEIKNV